MRFGWRLTLWYGVALGFTLLLAGIATYLGAAASFRNETQHHLAVNARSFERHVGVPVAEAALGDPRRTLPVASSEAVNALFPLLAEVRAADGSVVSRSRALNGANLPPAPVGGGLAIVPFHGGHWAVASWGFTTGGRTYRVEVAGLWDPTAATLRSLRSLLLLVGVGGVLLAFIGGVALSRAAVADIDAIRRAAEAIGATDLSKRVPLRGTGDELDSMAESFNNLLGRVEEAYTRQARFVADASHELRTPATIIGGLSSMLVRWGAERPDVLHDALAAMARQSEHLGRLVNELLSLARGDMIEPTQRRPLDLCELAREVVGDAPFLSGQRTLTLEPCHAALVDGDPVRLRQVLNALLDNAVRFTEETGHIRIGVDVDGHAALLEVADDGPGFRPADLAHVFDRFFRGEVQPAGRRGGAGLGLAIARAIVVGHGGGIQAGNGPAGGAVVRVTLPLSR